MKALQIFGIFLIFIGLIFSFYRLTGFSVLGINLFLPKPFFIFTFIIGVLFFISGRSISGGLENVLNDEILGVITFVRHGEQEDDGMEPKKNLTKKGEKQARTLGNEFKDIYRKRNEGDLYLASGSSTMARAYKTVKQIMGAEPRYNKPIIMDKRLLGVFPIKALEKHSQISKEKGIVSANDWYVNSTYGEKTAEGIANFLLNNETKLKKISVKGKKFHYVAGTHEMMSESLLKRVIINKDGAVGLKTISEIGGTLGLAEPINFLLKKDGNYQINFRGKVYDVDSQKLRELAQKYSKN